MTKKAHARRNDPATSHEAAELIDDLTRMQSCLHAVLRRSFGRKRQFTLEDCERVAFDYDPIMWKKAQSARSRCSELIQEGYVIRLAQRGKNSDGHSVSLHTLA